MVSVEEDLALNNADGRDRLASGMHPLGLSETAYSAMIWDADSQMYSNNKEPKKGVTMIEGGNAGANIHLVKPEGEGVYFGVLRMVVTIIEKQEISSLQEENQVKTF